MLIVLSILIIKVSENFGLPALLLFLGVGMLAGSDGIGGIYFEDVSVTQSVGMLALGLFIIVALLIDWQKALLYVIIPQQFALFSVLIFNYIQHVHADEESDYNHSRNFVSPTTNFMLFNNGFHTIHHFRASIHWSETPEAHKSIDHLIAPHLKERGFWPYIIKAYIIAPFNKTFRTKSMRLERILKEEKKSAHV